MSIQWRHNGRDSVSNHQPHDCLLSGLFRRRSKKTLKLRVTGLCAGNSPGTGEFPAQMASNAENVSNWCIWVALDSRLILFNRIHTLQWLSQDKIVLRCDSYIYNTPSPFLMIGITFNHFANHELLPESYHWRNPCTNYSLKKSNEENTLWLGIDEHGFHRRNDDIKYAFTWRLLNKSWAEQLESPVTFEIVAHK